MGPGIQVLGRGNGSILAAHCFRRGGAAAVVIVGRVVRGCQSRPVLNCGAGSDRHPRWDVGVWRFEIDLGALWIVGL